ncbi:NAD(P)/FAD-dependent oxidoreductase [Coralloluteibacterium stylophorae]|uniref:NAD(P)/FAD-dependent oxidoreductase n=1 Tax=Coralloluteibacterium stylophorae TaxID=1776034 RepID=A0A8J7VXB6_9GAMM|nr:NAD(P)/FAD-dependent oxidoreductase [Coralloluteibacterium stylophorae]MBS7455647.1 NAD(P)/FAD-dependent oxidoreductase [Coralloluteibacterium stylophorae]
MSFDVVVIGGGAAGLMCALTAGRRGRRVLVLEHAERVGKKILMSGGGRCNFTNLHTTPENFISGNRHFCKSALARFRPADFVAMVEAHGVAYHEKELGQLFCDVSSKLIVRMLVDECRDAGVEIRTGVAVGGVAATAPGFTVEAGVQTVHADSLVVATGGLSIPRMGATGFGFDLARRFGHEVLPLRAGLVPLTLSGAPLERNVDLPGVALPVEARANGRAFRNAMLFTHRGLSGPAILQISSYWQPGDALEVDLLPDRDAHAWLCERRAASPDAELRSVLAEALPRRLAQRLCEHDLGGSPRMRRLQPRDLARIAGVLSAWPVVASGTEGYRTAEVTLGGVDTDGLDSRTMMSRQVAGLFFIGEVVDVTGHLGGFNFQWAWACGHAAGLAA